MSIYKLFSSQTGCYYEMQIATCISEAIDKFAQARGFDDHKSMWAAGHFEYITAEEHG